jgi:NAD(P)H-quinone oxidoreductase subunit K
MGNCTVSGGIFYYDTYSVMPGVDSFLPVDVYLPGCPPRPEALQDAALQLRAKISNHSIAEGRVYEHKLLLPTSADQAVVPAGGGERA